MEMASLSLCFLLFLHLPFLSFAQFDPSPVYQISYHPRAFLYEHFLSYEECDHLISLAADKLERSMVDNTESGKQMESEERTSSGMFLPKRQPNPRQIRGSSPEMEVGPAGCSSQWAAAIWTDPTAFSHLFHFTKRSLMLRVCNYRHMDEIVARIERRIATWTLLPEENGEPIQVLKYRIGEKYDPHWDPSFDRDSQPWEGPRVATVLMYLSNVTKGGETIFPYTEGSRAQPKNETWSDCAKGVTAVKPVKGDALLFFSVNLDGTPDGASLHGGCPVIEGEKWSATQWIHTRSFTHRSLDT